MLAQRVSPPTSGMSRALSTATCGGSVIQVTSVCQPSASGGLSSVSSMYCNRVSAPSTLDTGKTLGSPKRAAKARCWSSDSA